MLIILHYSEDYKCLYLSYNQLKPFGGWWCRNSGKRMKAYCASFKLQCWGTYLASLLCPEMLYNDFMALGDAYFPGTVSCYPVLFLSHFLYLSSLNIALDLTQISCLPANKLLCFLWNICLTRHFLAELCLYPFPLCYLTPPKFVSRHC